MAGARPEPLSYRAGAQGAPEASTLTTQSMKAAAAPAGAGGPSPRASTRTPLYQSAFDFNKEVRVVHREQVANPAPLGLFGFGLTTVLLQGGNTAITEGGTRFLVYAFAFAFGGLTQLLAGMWEFKRQNTFGATAFSCYGAFWIGIFINGTLVAAKVYQPVHEGEKMMLALWGILTFILMIPTLELNFALFSLFFTLSLLFFVLTGGVAATVWTRIGGWLGIFVGGLAWYIAAADVINEEYQMTVLPLGKWSVGRPMARAARRMFRRVPGLSICVRGAEREDRKAGFVSEGKKGAAAKTAEGAGPSGAATPVYVDVYDEERQTGHPHLWTASETPLGSFEAEAVHRVQRTADVRSGIGPY